MHGDWQGALDFLYGFTNWETRRTGDAGDHPFELGRIVALLDALGRPQYAWPAVHVGGTNGKGSTCAMVAAVLRAAGHRVGLYTSPHLHTVRERIQVDGRLISEVEVLTWIERRRGLLDGFRDATTFEVLTAMAFEHFRDAAIDIAIVEVGLGGRLDTTRVVSPLACALTPISLDHTEVLGNTVRQIASDKVGILRPGTPVVTAPQPADAETIIEAERLRLGCPRLAVGVDIVVEALDRFDPAQRILLRHGRGGDAEGALLARPIEARLGLEGPHQRVNAAVATGLCVALERAGWSVPREALRAGLAATRWPARFERFEPPGGGAPIIVDGAHNPGSMRALRQALHDRMPGVPIRMILGVGVGKDLSAMLDALLTPAAAADAGSEGRAEVDGPAPEILEIVATRSEHPKAMAPSALAEAVAARGVPVTACPTPGEAVDRALAAAATGECIVATGSLFLAADVREALAERGLIPMPERDPPPI